MVKPQKSKAKLTTCPFCGASVDQGSNFCSSCGTILKIPDATRGRCPQCGAQVSEFQTVCFVCNRPLEESTAPPTAAPDGEKDSRPSPLSIIDRLRPALLPIGIGVFVVFFLIIIWLAPSEHGQQQAKPPVPVVEKETGLSAKVPSPPPLPSPPPRVDILEPVAPVKPEQKIEAFLNNFRSTQLQKDLKKYLAFYAPNFPDLKNKKETISKFWADYDYVNLGFKILEIKPVSENTFFVKVSWDAGIKNHKNGTIYKLKNAYNLTLKFEANKLLIIKVKPGESTPG
jgi:hypothetical protein